MEELDINDLDVKQTPTENDFLLGVDECGAGFKTPLQFTKATEWTTPFIIAGVTNEGASCRINRFGYVEIVGGVTGNNLATMISLPSDFRPNKKFQLIVLGYVDEGSDGIPVRIEVNTNGQVDYIDYNWKIIKRIKFGFISIPLIS